MSTAAVRSEAEMEAATALLQLFYDPRVFTEKAPAPTGHLWIDTRHSMSEIRAEVPAVQSTTIGPTSVRGPQTFQFTVTAGDSKHMIAPNPTHKQIVTLPCNEIIIQNELNNTKQNKNLQSPKWKLNLHKKYIQEQRRWALECKNRKEEKMTCDFILQTEHDKFYQTLVVVYEELCTEIKNLRDQIEQIKKTCLDRAVPTNTDGEVANPTPTKKLTSEGDVANPAPSTSSSRSTRLCRAKTDSYCSMFTPSVNSNKSMEYKEEVTSEEDEDDDEEEMPPAKQKRRHSFPQSSVRKAVVKTEMVPIGDGNAKVPSRLLKQLDWSSYTSATRKLLTAVFSRKVLATHSLSGKPSPAFPNKPAKKRLDVNIVNDVVLTVREHCKKVSEAHVRAIITTKCADESKMYRSRLRNNNKRCQSKKENFAPSDSTSEDSS